MKRAPFIAVFAALVLTLAAACSAKVDVKSSAGDAEAALQSAMAVDKAFSDEAQKAGVAEAFAKYMDSVDGKMIGPGAVTTGEAAIRAAFAAWPAGQTLTWSPDMGHASKSGDLAVTSGRWTRARDGAVTGQGRYVTVWRKNDAGEWKGVMDLGVDDPPPPAPSREPDPEGRPG